MKAPAAPFIRPEAGDPLGVGIVDDHPMFRVGLRETLQAEPGVFVFWDVGSGEEALSCLETSAVDVVLMDVTLKGKLDGLAATALIRGRLPQVSVVMMSALVDDRTLIAARRARAHGYLSKDLAPDAFVRCLRALLNPTTWKPLPVPGNLLDGFEGGTTRVDSRRQGTQLLTLREAEVATYIRDGRTNREIGVQLGVSRPTIDKHVQKILVKLQARNRAHAVSLLGDPARRDRRGT
jgi:DNA-binding NarL/FixJ family response regulator